MATIAEILAYPKGAPVQDVTARVVNAYKPRSGEGQYGPWSVMDLDLQDATGTIKAAWWYNMVAEPEQIKGERVTISATPDNKGNLRGAVIEHHEYQGKVTIRVKVNGDRLQLAPEASTAPAATPTNGTHPSPPSAAPSSGRLTLSAYLSATGAAYRYATDVLGVSDQQAAVAFANTVGIATSQGRILADAIEEPDAPF